MLTLSMTVAPGTADCILVEQSLQESHRDESMVTSLVSVWFQFPLESEANA
ncbi:hypothetical protein ES703_72843 [subsurface metagenome]